MYYLVNVENERSKQITYYPYNEYNIYRFLRKLKMRRTWLKLEAYAFAFFFSYVKYEYKEKTI